MLFEEYHVRFLDYSLNTENKKLRGLSQFILVSFTESKTTPEDPGFLEYFQIDRFDAFQRM